MGFKHSKDTLAKFAVREVSEETRNNLSIAATGRILTEEEKLKISSKRKGIQLSSITRKKIFSVSSFKGYKNRSKEYEY